MSTQGEGSEQRAYSPEEINSCFHFFKLPKPIASTSSPTIEWWPCLVFANMMELNMITQQLGLWSSLPKHIMMSYMQRLPASATCRVALLTGERPPPGTSVIHFDIKNGTSTSEATSSFTIEPFYEKVFEFVKLYVQRDDFVKAVQQTIPVLQQVAESVHSNTNGNSTQDEGCNVTCCNRVATSTTEENRCESTPEDVPLSNLASINHHATTKQDIPAVELPETPETKAGRDREEIEGSSSNSNVQEKEIATTKAPLSSSKENRSKTKIPVNRNVEFVDIPTFKDVKGALLKGGYILKSKHFCRPPLISDGKAENDEVFRPSPRFKNAKELRDDLCAHGVNCRCGTSMDEENTCQCWTDDEKWNIKLWVRYNVIRGPINVSSPVQVISSIHQATKYLIRIGYKRRQLESSLTTSEQVHELFRYLSQYGLPKEGDEDAQCCDYTAISPEERFSLEYFISTNRFRVKTFTYVLPTTEEPVPPTLIMEVDSPGPSSVVRPKRSVALRQQKDEVSVKKLKVTHDEGGATIVSVESNVSVVAKSGSSTKYPTNNENKRKHTTTAKNPLSVASESIQRQTIESESSDFHSYRSPILRSHISSTKEDTPKTKRLPQQRVSLSPIVPPVKFEEVSLPVFDGCDHDKLVSCLDALKPSNCANLPTICSTDTTTAKKSKFAANILKVSHFVQAVLTSRGRSGTGNTSEDASAALYVCGAPGLGKTSGVHWCCNYVAKSTVDNDVKIKICHVNASYLTAQSTPLQLVMKEIATSMGIKASHPSESKITKLLCDSKNSAILLVVVDEVDAFVTGNGRATNGSECLQTLLQWANNSTMQMGLIGISNCMNDNKFSAIRELGAFVETVTFSPYSEYELQQILLARVGETVIAPNVIDFIAKKVATSTGDARKALEMAANAVQHKIDQSDDRMSVSADGHLVRMPNVIQANKEEVMNLKDRISGLPAVGKVILCVLTSYAQVSGAVNTTVGELKQCVSDCMRQTGMEDEMVQMDDFLVLLETLVDSGLLRASRSTTHSSKGNGLNLSQRTLADVHRQPIRLGIQLDDIEKVLESDLTQTFYQNLRERARSLHLDE